VVVWLEVLGFGQSDTQQVLLLLGVGKITERVKDKFLDFLIKIVFCKFTDCRLELVIESGLDVDFVEYFFGGLAAVVAGTGKKKIGTVENQVPTDKEILFGHLVADSFGHSLRKCEHYQWPLGALNSLAELDGGVQ
jgi:hypothetical protein